MPYYPGCLGWDARRILLSQALCAGQSVCLYSLEFSVPTSAGAKNLCGHFSAFDDFVLAFDPLLFDTGFAP